jgi:hypothetical protein
VIEHQLRAIFRTVMASGGDLRDAYRLCTDPAAVPDHLARIADPTLRSFWLHEFPALPASRRLAVANKLAPILLQPALSGVLAARTSAFDADRLIGERRVLIANLSAGSTSLLSTCLVGTFLVQKILAAAIRQQSLPPEKRRRHFLLIDEFALFMETADAAGFEQLLATARSMRLSLVVAHQHLDQVAPSVRAALLGNVSTFVAFRVGLHDAQAIAPMFRGVRPEQLIDLSRGRCVARIGAATAFLRTPPPPPPLPSDPTPRLRAATHAHIASFLPAAEDVSPPSRQSPEPPHSDADEFVR